MQETVPRVIGNHSKLVGRVYKSSKMNPQHVSGVLGALGSMHAERLADKDEKWSHFGATYSLSGSILAPAVF